MQGKQKEEMGRGMNLLPGLSVVMMHGSGPVIYTRWKDN